ncbi:luciferase family protein [Methylobacterium sp. 4-46]|uniref:TIGR03885 family FMN-dependent LLM class oxidoreductase n=1 Tax=unclassified Methylobacterium TaxID=2615210 RepID=UPI000152CCD4|nr:MULTISPECIES: TIGR03885 family FMN-dependent LLM class oxidoreductase [Methylobacterium]ACA20610.1 luciferase family protein [Methylobacterium sp. 4-46]WFT79775.1 TIGR03885 family FMN-dependent LLM class oxidoreductase [Methylobacterium nodulans]
MTLFSYHASHEQVAPRDLLAHVQRAEQAGFDGAFSSDHLQPWSAAQGQSGFAWAWLGAALQATQRLTFGIITVPGGWRYHPAVLAQAVATLGQMYPGRLPWVALGSGQALNESVTGTPWPDRPERHARLREGAEIMRALLAGETVTHRGRVSALDAKVWSRPETPTRLVGAATTPETAAWLGTWADGLLTVGSRPEALAPIVEAFRETGGADKPIFLKLDLSFARDPAEALAQAHAAWRFNQLGSPVAWELRSPAEFDAASRFVRPEDMHAQVLVSADLGEMTERIAACAALGFDSIDLHQVGGGQAAFIDAFGERVLPALRARRAPAADFDPALMRPAARAG